MAESAASVVSGPRGTVSPHDERHAERAQRAAVEKRKLYDWAEDNGKLISTADMLKTDKGGGEHKVLLRGNKPVIKETRPEIGFGGGLALNDSQAATAGDYLERIKLTNQEFGTHIKLLGVRRTALGPAIRTSMPFVKGVPATPTQVDSAMTGPGYEKIGEGAYYHAGKGIVSYDMHPKNVVFRDGKIYPIDAIVQQVSASHAQELKQIYFRVADVRRVPLSA